MNELERTQRRWLDAARRQQGPPTDAVARMRRGLVSRIAAAEPAPIWQPEPTTETMPATGPVHLGPWLVGGALLLAAAAVVLWMGVRPTPELTRAADPNAAGYGVQEGKPQRVTPAVQGEPVAPRTREDESRDEAGAGGVAPGEAAPSTPASAADDRPRAEAPSRREVHRGAPSPSSETPASAPVPASPPPLMRPAGVSPSAEADSPDEGAGLDVAGEAALLNRTKAAIDGEQWSVASRRLGEYRRRYPAGVLAPEARALEVVVACGREATGAQDRARQFLKANPGSSLRERVRRSCGLDS